MLLDQDLYMSYGKMSNTFSVPGQKTENICFTARYSGSWYVTKYNLFMNLYWNKPPYQLTLIYNNGRVIIRGLEITDEGFSLTNDEGRGGYIPASDEDVMLTEDHG